MMFSFVKFAEESKTWQEAKAFFPHILRSLNPPAHVMQRIDFASTSLLPNEPAGLPAVADSRHPPERGLSQSAAGDRTEAIN